MSGRPRGWAAIKTLAAEYGKPYRDLLVLANANDPFYCGQPAQRRQAEWFAEVWHSLGDLDGAHLRRIHYQALSVGISLLDGSAYLNTDAHWKLLQDASKFARTLELVPVEAFVDRRNPAPHLYAPEPRTWTPAPGAYRDEDDITEVAIPYLSSSLSRGNFAVPDLTVSGYDYAPADQPYHLEVWIEKSTMNDVLVPLCSRLGADLVTGVGFQSISSVAGKEGLLGRAARHGKPTRIFYIADFDPAGTNMPRSVARQIEYWHDAHGNAIEVKLAPIALTREQVIEYELPRIPIKDDDKRKANFEDRFGEGAVELDALEALHPGELARIVSEAVEPYIDRTLEHRLEDVEVAAQELLDEQWEEHTADERGTLADIASEIDPIRERYGEKLEALQREYLAETAALQDRVDGVRQAISERLGDFEPWLPPRPEADLPPGGETGWLFDSGRDYLTQIDAYKEIR